MHDSIVLVNEGLTWELFYATLAEEVFPCIEVSAGRTVDVVVSRGLIVTTRMDIPEK